MSSAISHLPSPHRQLTVDSSPRQASFAFHDRLPHSVYRFALINQYEFTYLQEAIMDAIWELHLLTFLLRPVSCKVIIFEPAMFILISSTGQTRLARISNHFKSSQIIT